MEIATKPVPALYLVMPPQLGLLAGFATGLLSLKRYLEFKLPEANVEIVDLSSEADAMIDVRLAELAVGDDAVVIGVTVSTATYQSALSVARSAKQRFGDRAVVVFGGPHASADAEVILNCHSDSVDYVVRGEGERALELFLRHWPNVEKVPNLCWKPSGSDVTFNTDAPALTQSDLDLITIDRSWFIEQTCAGKFSHFTYVSARGCPLKCKFCSVANQAIRGKSAEVVAAEVREIVSAGYGRIAIEDNFFAHTPRRTKEVCAALKALREEGLDFRWDCQTRVEAAARPGVGELLAGAGCEAAYLGVEALDSAALQFLGKAQNCEHYLRQLCDAAVPQLLNSGIDVYLNLQFGLPSEAGSRPKSNVDVLAQIGRYAAERGRKITIFPQLFVVYPGTVHFSQYLDDCVFWASIFEDFTTWEIDHRELTTWMGRFFAHGVGGIPLGLLDRGALAARKFVIANAQVLEAANAISALEDLEGIQVFRFTNHLAPLQWQAAPTTRHLGDSDDVGAKIVPLSGHERARGMRASQRSDT